MRKHLENLSLKNKILFSSLAVIMLVSIAIALLARYILVSSLTKELELRGVGIAQSIADRSKSLMLTQDEPSLVALAFEASVVGERKTLVSYIYILDKNREVLASTFITPFPAGLAEANFVPDDAPHAVTLVSLDKEHIYDVAVSVREGIYAIGSVHVGLRKGHIDQIIATLRITFIGFVSLIVAVMFLITQRLARAITRPLNQLTALANEISRDNLDINLDMSSSRGCNEIVGCGQTDCPAYSSRAAACWSMEDTLCGTCPPMSEQEKLDKLEHCKRCPVYKSRHRDEVLQLADAFTNMVRHIKDYRSELKRSQLKYRSLFHSGPDPIFVLDCEQHVILDANPMATEIFGATRKELIGRPFEPYAPDLIGVCARTFRPGDEEAMTTCLSYPKQICYREDGQPFYANVHACGTIYEDIPAIIVSANDVTDTIEKDAQLIQASKMKTLGEMSAGMAHELNQPLNAIRLGSEFLALASENGHVDPDQLAKVTQKISAQVDRAAEIIDTLRAFGRKADMTKDLVDVNKLVENVLTIIGHQLTLDNIEIDLELTPELPAILAHSNRLEQVLFNLVQNGRDAILMRAEASENGSTPRTIAISTRVGEPRADQNEDQAEGKGRVAIEVRDSGCGISQADLDKIFEPFYTTKELGKGMGLGLAISYGIIKDYDGEIRVTSKLDDHTTFTLSFPAS